MSSRRPLRPWVLAIAALLALAPAVAPASAFAGVPEITASSGAAPADALAGTTSTGTGTAIQSTSADPPAQSSPPEQVYWATRPADTEHGTGRSFFDYTLSPGDHLTDAVEVENRGAKPLTLQVYAADAFTTSSGTIDLAPGGTRSVDAGTWVSVAQPTVTVAPHAKVTVSFTVTVPDNAGPGDHPAGLVTSLTSGDNASGVAVERRLGSRLYVRVPGNLAPSARIDAVSAHYVGTANPFGSGRAEIIYRLTNTGNVRITPQEAVQIRGFWGLVTATDVSTDPMPDVLPGSTITRTVRVAGVWPLVLMGAAVTVTPTPSDIAGAGLGSPVAAAGTFWAAPWPQLGVILIVVGLIIGWRLGLRRRRGAVQQRIDDAVRATRAEYERG